MSIPDALIAWSLYPGNRCIVLCPYCLQPEYHNNGRDEMKSLCNQGQYLIRGRFDWSEALIAVAQRRKDLAAKRKYKEKPDLPIE